MKNLNRIEIKDFKIFKGKHKIAMSRDTSKPITVIETHRGSGKTTLQGAIYWCLFGETISRYNDAHLLNHETASQMEMFGSETVEVELVFNTGAKLRSFKRVQNYSKKLELAATGQLLFIDGEQCDRRTYAAAINELTHNGLGKMLFISNEIDEKTYSRKLMREIFSNIPVNEHIRSRILDTIESEVTDLYNTFRKLQNPVRIKFAENFQMEARYISGELAGFPYGATSILNLSLALACIKVFEETLSGLPIIVDELLPMHMDDEFVKMLVSELYPWQMLILLHNVTAAKLMADEDEVIGKWYSILPNEDYTGIEINTVF